MGKQTFMVRKLLLAMLATYSVTGFAAAPGSGAYVTDKTSQFVEDQTSQVLNGVNGVLCHMDAMATDQLVNKGAYIALVDQNVCSSGGGGGQNKNSGANYVKATVTSTMAAASGSPLIADVWLKSQRSNIQAHAVAKSGKTTSLPYGDFSLHYCGKSSSTAKTCDVETGYIIAGTNGLSYFSTSTDTWGSNTDALTINSTSADAGSGVVDRSVSPKVGGAGAAGGSSMPTATNIIFAYNANNFLRSSDKGVTSQCFDRTLANADKTDWTYGVYDSTGAHFNRNGGFPVDYTDSTGVSHNGYVGYWGFWSDAFDPVTFMPVMPANGTKINGYPNGTSTASVYTFQQTGGTLMKHTRTLQTLKQMDKLRFWYWNMQNLPAAATGTQAAGSIMAAGVTYEVYWDDAAGQFMVGSVYDMTNFIMTPLATPRAIPNADFVAANAWGLWAYSSMTGGYFTIDSTAMASLATTKSTTKLTFTSDDIVYPSDFAALGNLQCIGDCPTRALIDSTYVANPATTTSPFQNAGLGGMYSGTWTWDAVNNKWVISGNTVPTASLVTYTLDAATGNLVDAAGKQVINTGSSNGFSTQVYSGRMFAVADKANIDTAKAAVVGNPAGQYNEGDLNLNNPKTNSPFVYYTWQTSANVWDQLSLMKDSNNTVVKFDAPLMMTYTVPANTDTVNLKPYGVYAGTTMQLTYNGFGDLWGIPYQCVDLATNTACNFATLGTAMPTTWSWKPAFSIPYDGVGNSMTATVNATTNTYWAKPMDEEVRLAKVASTVCSGAGLTIPATTPALPTATGFVDPSSNGAAPTVTNPSPRVIQGVVQY